MSGLEGWKFPICVDEDTGKIKTVKNNENVSQAIKIILGTYKNERKIVTKFGTNLRDFMFEIVNPEFISSLNKSINSSIKTWEEHITSIHVKIKASAGPISIVEAIIDYLTDLEPIQERINTRIDANDKE